MLPEDRETRELREPRDIDSRDCEFLFRMSLKIGRNELVDLAREIEGQGDLEKTVRRCNEGFLKKLEKKFWENLVEKYPGRDFSGTHEGRTRINLRRKLKTLLKG